MHHINLWEQETSSQSINHSTYQTPNSEAKPPASSQTYLRAETESYAAGRRKINSKTTELRHTAGKFHNPWGVLPLKSAKQTRLGASNHRVKQDFEPPDANFPYGSRCEHADARKGSKNASNRMRNRCGRGWGGGALGSRSLSLLPRRMHFGKGGSPERGGLNSNLTTVSDLPLGRVLGLTL